VLSPSSGSPPSSDATCPPGAGLKTSHNCHESGCRRLL
jgi:hypothetical protein